MVSHGLSFRALSLVCLGLLGLGLFDDLFDLLSVSNDFVFVDSEGVASTASDVELKLDDITRLQLTKHLFWDAVRAAGGSVMGNTENSHV